MIITILRMSDMLSREYKITQEQALNILKTGANVFLTGGPGSGKTYTINRYVKYLKSHGIEPAITASTGIAATHIGGMTIHSWSGIGIKKVLDKRELNKIAGSQYIEKRVRKAKVLIVEEVSMLTGRTLSMVDAVCRVIKQILEPFGGMQVIFAGDFFQLPPVVKRDSDAGMQTAFIDEAVSHFAYDSPAWQEADPAVCYLTEQHRQDDSDFLSVLAAIRGNDFNDNHLRHLEGRKIESSAAPSDMPKLFSHNADVDRINNEVLVKLSGKSREFDMFSHGLAALVATLKKGCLSPDMLNLKVGAAVMFTKNNPKEGFINGTLGIVEDFDEEDGLPVVKVRSGKRITVKPMDWSVEENGKVRAQITQLPLRLAWAITVHKSQGMSLDGAVMDLSDVFEFGQGYVALSRVRRLSGLHLIGWNKRAFEVHPDVLSKDEGFQIASDNAKTRYSHISSVDLAKKHDAHIIASGGKLKSVNYIQSRGYDKVREFYPNAYRPWSKQQDRELQHLFADGFSVKDLAVIFSRKQSAIRSRLIKLGLMEE